jgi:hypothetical protein
MNPGSIFTNNVLVTLFENRNKTYGISELRKQYNRQFKKVMFITTAVSTVNDQNIIVVPINEAAATLHAINKIGKINS